MQEAQKHTRNNWFNLKHTPILGALGIPVSRSNQPLAPSPTTLQQSCRDFIGRIRAQNEVDTAMRRCIAL